MSLLELANKDGRTWTRIGNNYGVTKKPRELNVRSHPAIPFIPMESVPQGGAYEPSFVLKSPDALTSGTYLERGDVLVSKITPSFENGKQALVRSLPLPFGYATTEVIPLRPFNCHQQDPRLLFFYLLHPDVRHYVAERMEGSTGRQRVPESVLLDLPMPDIDPKEQVRMADSLELIQMAMTVENKAAESAQELKRATMTRLFTRGLRGEAQKETGIGLVPESWALDLLGAHHTVVSGGTPSRSNPAFWTEGTIPWVKTTEVDYCVVSETEEHITQQGLENSAAKMLPVGTLLMAMYGQGVTRGKIAILGIEAACNQACAAITPNDGAVHPRYLYHFLAWRYEAIRSLAHGGQQQNLNLEIVRDLPLAYPQALDEQREIVTLLDALDRKIALHRQKRAVLEELFQSLLHKLMTGEIRVADLDLSALSERTTTKGGMADSRISHDVIPANAGIQEH